MPLVGYQFAGHDINAQLRTLSSFEDEGWEHMYDGECPHTHVVQIADTGLHIYSNADMTDWILHLDRSEFDQTNSTFHKALCALVEFAIDEKLPWAREEFHNQFRGLFPAAPIMHFVNDNVPNQIFEGVILTAQEMVACGLWADENCDDDSITHAIVFQHGWHIECNEHLNKFRAWIHGDMIEAESFTTLFKMLCVFAKQEGAAIEGQKA